MSKIKKNESASSKDSRRKQTNKIRGSNIMACILYLEDGSAVWYFHNNEGGEEAGCLPKEYLDAQKTIRDALKAALYQLVDFVIRFSCQNKYPL